MCGRYASVRSRTQLAAAFAVPETLVEVRREDYNVTPAKRAPVVLTAAPSDAEPGAESVRQIRLAQWGLRPGWMKDGRGFPNARAETLSEKRSFRTPLTKRRCLVPCDGFYEWFTADASEGGTPTKQPYFFTPHDGSVLAMAGLVEYAHDPKQPELWTPTYTIITTTATDDAGLVHERMPMTVTPDNWAAWLDPAMTDVAEAQTLMAPPASGSLKIYKVGTAVNKSTNNGPELIKPLD
jgi:putative SOS response-associated peptidase YedK